MKQVNNRIIKEWLSKLSFLEEELQYFFLKMKRMKQGIAHTEENGSVNSLSTKILNFLTSIKKKKNLITNSDKVQVINNAEITVYINKYEEIKRDVKTLIEKFNISGAA
ncbi:MAG: hypothetical protein AAGI07_10070 [Bacteroidota bacterium]